MKHWRTTLWLTVVVAACSSDSSNSQGDGAGNLSVAGASGSPTGAAGGAGAAAGSNAGTGATAGSSEAIGGTGQAGTRPSSGAAGAADAGAAGASGASSGSGGVGGAANGGSAGAQGGSVAGVAGGPAAGGSDGGQGAAAASGGGGAQSGSSGSGGANMCGGVFFAQDTCNPPCDGLHTNTICSNGSCVDFVCHWTKSDLSDLTNPTCCFPSDLPPGPIPWTCAGSAWGNSYVCPKGVTFGLPVDSCNQPTCELAMGQNPNNGPKAYCCNPPKP